MTFSILVAAFLLLPGSTLNAWEAWPDDTEWVGLLSKDWAKSTDPDDQSSDYLDIVPDSLGYDSYFYSTATSLFIRIGLQGTFINNKGELLAFAWQVPIDVNGDNLADWNIVVGGISEALRVYYDGTTAGDPGNLNWEIASPIAANYVREMATPMTTNPDFVYMEIQVPYTALQGSGVPAIDITLGTPIAFYFSTASSESISIKDATGGSATITEAFANALIVGTGTASFGFVYDNLDPAPYTSGATYAYGETVSLDGYGWPPSRTNLSVFIKDAGGTEVWSSNTVSTDINGDLITHAAWTVGGTYTSGTCTIWVTHPTLVEEGDNSYDTFTVTAAPAPASFSLAKVVTPTTVASGGTVQYTITVTNTGETDENAVTFVDTLADGFSYVSGSTSGTTTSDPSISGQILSWNGTWAVLKNNGTQSLTFEAKAGLQNTTYYNQAEVIAETISSVKTGETAALIVQAPVLVLSKSVDLANAAPGDILTYTITYSNTGDADATVVTIIENIPANTVYVDGSASATPAMDISFTTVSTVVTSIQFLKSTNLAVGGSGSLTFKVIIE